MCVHLSSFWSHLAFFLVTIVDLTLLLYFTHHYIASAVRVLFLPRIRVDAVPKFKFKLRPLAGNALMWCFKISEIFTCMCVCIKNTLKIFWISRRLYRCASSGASVDQGILTLEWHRDQIRSHMITTLTSMHWRRFHTFWLICKYLRAIWNGFSWFIISYTHIYARSWVLRVILGSIEWHKAHAKTYM